MISPLALHEGAQMITILVHVSCIYVSNTRVPRNLMKKIVQMCVIEIMELYCYTLGVIS